MRNKLSAIAFIFLISIGLFSCKENDLVKAPIIESITPPSNGVGVQINIKGSNFGTAVDKTTINFNGTQAYITSLSDTLIITHVPVGATSGKITITAANGRTVSSEDDFEILTGHWQQKADIPDDQSAFGIAFSVGNKGYYGLGEFFQYLKNFYMYNPATNLWTSIAEFPGDGRIHCASFIIAGKAYVGLGSGDRGVNFNDFYQYNADINQWSRIADFPGGSRVSVAAFSIDGKGYVGLGTNDESADVKVYHDLWEYDPDSNTWTQKADFPSIQRYDALGFNVGSFGFTGVGSPQDLKDWWKYNPATDSWTRLSDYSGTGWTFDATGFSLNNKIYFIEGYSTTCWEYNPSTDDWTQKTSLPENITGCGAFSIEGKAYVITGMFTGHNHLFEFNPE